MDALLETPHDLIQDGLAGLVPGRGFGAVGLVAGSVLPARLVMLVVGPVVVLGRFAVLVVALAVLLV
ncbi:hypothetical protein [Kineosporia sp. NBRC 101731]|uniref:hypothetical protein n=1 Tax=Kineosporia sp. NBRC 101731 TaxID=3032199 RepID=UPI0025522C89|nr:hypothetical protein [Kineosporia sp. NBRC 101731]